MRGTWCVMISVVVFLINRLPPRATRTDTRFPYTPLSRSPLRTERTRRDRHAPWTHRLARAHGRAARRAGIAGRFAALARGCTGHAGADRLPHPPGLRRGPCPRV